MEIRQLELFLAVLDCATVTRAAEKVNLTPGWGMPWQASQYKGKVAVLDDDQMTAIRTRRLS